MVLHLAEHTKSDPQTLLTFSPLDQSQRKQGVIVGFSVLESYKNGSSFQMLSDDPTNTLFVVWSILRPLHSIPSQTSYPFCHSKREQNGLQIYKP